MESKEDDSKDAFLGETKVPRQPHIEPSVEISQMQTVDGNGPGLVGHLLRHLGWEHPHWPVDGIELKIGGQFQPVGGIEELSSAANHLVAAFGRTRPLLKGTPTPDTLVSIMWP